MNLRIEVRLINDYFSSGMGYIMMLYQVLCLAVNTVIRKNLI
jgi:hypothetical protein